MIILFEILLTNQKKHKKFCSQTLCFNGLWYEIKEAVILVVYIFGAFQS